MLRLLILHPFVSTSVCVLTELICGECKHGNYITLSFFLTCVCISAFCSFLGAFSFGSSQASLITKRAWQSSWTACLPSPEDSWECVSPTRGSRPLLGSFEEQKGSHVSIMFPEYEMIWGMLHLCGILPNPSLTTRKHQDKPNLGGIQQNAWPVLFQRSWSFRVMVFQGHEKQGKSEELPQSAGD